MFIALLLFSVLTGYLLLYYDFQLIPLESLCPGARGYDDFVLLVGGFSEFFNGLNRWFYLSSLSIYLQFVDPAASQPRHTCRLC